MGNKERFTQWIVLVIDSNSVVRGDFKINSFPTNLFAFDLGGFGLE